MAEKKTDKTKPASGESINLPKVLRRLPLHHIAWGYCAARRDCRPGETWEETVEAFKQRFCIGQEDIIEASLIRELYRMSADFINEGL